MNFGSLFLSRQLRRQIRFKTEQMRLAVEQHTASHGRNTKVSRIYIGVRSSATQSQIEDSTDARKRRTKPAGGSVADQRKQLATLQKVERDLIFVGPFRSPKKNNN